MRLCYILHCKAVLRFAFVRLCRVLHECSHAMYWTSEAALPDVRVRLCYIHMSTSEDPAGLAPITSLGWLDAVLVLASRPQHHVAVGLQAFEKLVDRVGNPPAALPTPTSPLPPLDLTLPGIKDAEVGVPTWQDMGFTDPPTKVFKVRQVLSDAICSRLLGACPIQRAQSSAGAWCAAALPVCVAHVWT